MGYKTWFHKLQESNNSISPFKISQALVDGEARVREFGSGTTVNSELLAGDETKDMSTSEVDGDDTLEAQLEALQEELTTEPLPDDERKKEIGKEIEHIKKQIEARDISRVAWKKSTDNTVKSNKTESDEI
jgi:hypothetical protein